MNEHPYETGHQMGNLPNVVIFLLLAGFPFLGFGFFAFLIYVSYISVIQDGYSISFVAVFIVPLIGVAVLLLVFGWLFISKGLAKYCFQTDGLSVKYPFRAKTFIPWHDFQQVCVCYAAYTTRGAKRAATVICLVKTGEKKNIYGRWKTDNPFRYRSVITIDYKPELYTEIKKRCPLEVVDLRETQAYTLD